MYRKMTLVKFHPFFLFSGEGDFIFTNVINYTTFYLCKKDIQLNGVFFKENLSKAIFLFIDLIKSKG